ncbi:MAG: PstA family ABC transporter permease [Solirubrobacteraceae bacterium]
MASAQLIDGPAPSTIARPRRESTASWPLADRICHGLCWAAGIGLCLVAAWIVLYMLVKGVSALQLKLFVESPAPSLRESQSGGFRDPLIGTFIITTLGVAIAAPAGVGIATWLTEYAHPRWLARAVESGTETLAGVPTIVLALFGLLIFARGFLAFLSGSTNGGAVSGKSFLNAGMLMGVLALPLVVTATREALTQLPTRTREASFALGKTRATTIRRVLLPSIRPGIASGVVLGMGRIIGDTAIIVIVLGAAPKLQGAGGPPLLSTLRGSGSTLTSYVYGFSPAGEGNSPVKAFAAAFVLLMIVLALNALVTRLSRGLSPGAAGREARR